MYTLTSVERFDWNAADKYVMAEIITAVQTADAVQGLLSGVVKLVERILQARRDVQNLPKSIEEILQEVEGLKPVIDSIKSDSLDKNGFLKPRLEKLQEALDRASGQLNDFKEKQKQDKSSKAFKVAKATVNLGDSKRHKEINSTRETIKGLREELDKALSVSTHLTGEITYTIVKETQLMVKEVLVQKTVVVSSSVVTPPASIAKFDRWARECIGDESYKIHFMQWDSERHEYRLPEQGSRRETPGEDVKDEGDEIKRGAREGGWEVKNSTKVQFQIEVSRDCFFYVVSCEMPLTIPTNLELFFPKYSTDKNKIL